MPPTPKVAMSCCSGFRLSLLIFGDAIGDTNSHIYHKGSKGLLCWKNNGTDLRRHAWSLCLDEEVLEAPRSSVCCSGLSSHPAGQSAWCHWIMHTPEQNSRWGVGGWSSWQRTADENTMLMKTHQLIFFQILIFIKTTVISQTLPLWQGKIMTITTWRELFTKDLGDRIHAGFQLLPRDVSFGLLSLIADIWTEWTARQRCFTQKWDCIQRGCQTPLCGYFYSVYTLFLWVT